MDNEKIYQPNQVLEVLVEILDGIEYVQDVELRAPLQKVTFVCNHLARSIGVESSANKDAPILKIRATHWYASDLIFTLRNVGDCGVTRHEITLEIMRIADVWLDGDMYNLLESYIVGKGKAAAVYETSEYVRNQRVLELFLKDYEGGLGEFSVYVVPVLSKLFGDPTTQHGFACRVHEQLIVYYYVNASPQFLIENKNWAERVIEKIITLERERREFLKKSKN